MRGGIAEKGGVRVGHRIIEINSKLLQLTQAVNNSTSNPPQT